jgi:hypothetical protein
VITPIWFGYHENFNIYSNDNPVPTSGIIKLYSQHRYIQQMEWVKETFPIDASQVYTVGVSAGGYGAQLTAAIIPEEIAAVYTLLNPCPWVPTDSKYIRRCGEIRDPI